MSGDISKTRAETAAVRAGVSHETLGEAKTVRFGDGSTHTVRHVDDQTALGAGRAIGYTLAKTGLVALAPLAYAGTAVATMFGGGKTAAKWGHDKFKKAWTGAGEISKPGDVKRLGKTALKTLGALATLGTAFASKSFRQSWVKETAVVKTESTFNEMRSQIASERKFAKDNQYDKTDARSVAAFLNRMIDEGNRMHEGRQIIAEGGQMMWIDERNKGILFAEVNAEGRPVVHTARYLSVTRRGYSKDHPVSTRELYRAARAYGLCYDEAKEAGVKMADEITMPTLENSANNYLQKLSRKKQSVMDRLLLVEYLSHGGLKNDTQGLNAQAKLQRLREYFKRVPLAETNADVTRLFENFIDVQTEATIRADLAQNRPPTDENGYLTKHNLTEASNDAIIKHLDAQKFNRDKVKDHLQARVLADTGIAYTQVGQPNDTQLVAVRSAMHQKLASMAKRLYPNGVEGLQEAHAYFSSGTSTPEGAAYCQREGLNGANGQLDPDKANEHLEKVAKRYGVEDADQLAECLEREIHDAENIFRDAGRENIHSQRLLLEAWRGGELSPQEKANVTEYLKREGILSPDQKGVVKDFTRSGPINQALLEMHIDRLCYRYGIGGDQLLDLQKDETFLTQFEEAKLAEAAHDPDFKAYLQENGILPPNHQGQVSSHQIDKTARANHVLKLQSHYGQKNSGRRTAAIKGEVLSEVQKRLDAMVSNDYPDARLYTRLEQLIAGDAYTQGAVTAKQEAHEKVADLRMMKDIWDITTAKKTREEYAPERLLRLTHFLRSKSIDNDRFRQRKIDIPDDWMNQDWRAQFTGDDAAADLRADVRSVINRTLEAEAKVINTGGENAHQHVLETLGEQIEQLTKLEQGRIGGYKYQVESHKEALKTAPPERISLNIAEGKIKIRRELTFDDRGRETYKHDIEVSMKKGTAKSTKELWTEAKADRNVIPEQLGPPQPGGDRRRRRH